MHDHFLPEDDDLIHHPTQEDAHQLIEIPPPLLHTRPMHASRHSVMEKLETGVTQVHAGQANWDPKLS